MFPRSFSMMLFSGSSRCCNVDPIGFVHWWDVGVVSLSTYVKCLLLTLAVGFSQHRVEFCLCQWSLSENLLHYVFDITNKSLVQSSPRWWYSGNVYPFDLDFVEVLSYNVVFQNNLDCWFSCNETSCIIQYNSSWNWFSRARTAERKYELFSC